MTDLFRILSQFILKNHFQYSTISAGGSRTVGTPTPKLVLFYKIFWLKNAWKLKNLDPGARPWRPPGSANDFNFATHAVAQEELQCTPNKLRIEILSFRLTFLALFLNFWLQFFVLFCSVN